MKRFHVLDSFRGLAALGVVFFHFKSPAILHSLPLFQQGGLYVDFFFLLSGFVLAHAYGDRLRSRADARPFLVRRVARLWPLHMATLLVMLAIEFVGLAAYTAGVRFGREPFTGEGSPWALASNVFMVHAWGIHDGTTWNKPSWSISTEFGAYLLFMVLVMTLGKGLQRAAAALVVIASLAVLIWVAPGGIRSTYDFGLARCFVGFFIGTFLHLAWRHVGALPQGWATWFEAAVLSLGVAALCAPIPDPWSVVSVFGLASCVFVFAFEQGAISRVLQGPVLRWLGERSYSIYLLQGPMFVVWYVAAKVGSRSLGVDVGGNDGVMLDVTPIWLNDVVLLAFLAVLLILSDVSWRRLEVPAGRAMTRWLLPKEATSP